MIVALLALAIALLVLPGALRQQFARIPGAEATRLALGTLVIGTASLVFGLVALALPSVGHTLSVDAFEECRSVVGGFEPGGHLVGWIAALALLALVARLLIAAIGVRRAGDIAVDAWLGDHRHREDVDVVVLPTDELVAFGAHRASPPQIVISQGIETILDQEEVEAVLAHEHAHLRLRHHRHLEALWVIERAVGWIPFVRNSFRLVRVSIERWADESATVDASGRAALAGALVAVAASDRHVVGPAGGWRGLVDRTACLTHPVVAPPISTRAKAHGPTALLAGAALLVGVIWIAVFAAGGVPVTGCH